MPDNEQYPDVRQILGALILGADHPITPAEVRKIAEAVEEDMKAEMPHPVTDEELLAVQDGAKGEGEEGVAVGASSSVRPDVPVGADLCVRPPELGAHTGAPLRETDRVVPNIAAIREAFTELQRVLRDANVGMDVVEVSGGYRLQTHPECGPWVRKMLNRGKPTRLSRPTIETLAIIAYRQPIARSEIESIRGVSVGHVIKALMEMQLVRITGRSELPGRPFLFGTTTAFLDHFGLKDLDDLNAIQPGVARETRTFPK
ncbi:MAG: SMC-Scp complex subunit ScpB [Kiritimatiellaeota bacterium]|nr:SMC-Scp complex subunit ScpB [Kiritimatiellota bacterium]